MLTACTHCGAGLPPEAINATEVSICPRCSSSVVVRVFPAFFRKAAAITATETALGEGEASCYQHGTKRAMGACGQCGRFVCALCAIEIRGETFCPGCAAAGGSKRKNTEPENHRTLWDSIALGVAAMAIPFYPFWFLTGPGTLYIAVRYWRAPSSVVPRVKWRFAAAIVIAVAEMALFVVFVLLVVYAMNQKRVGR